MATKFSAGPQALGYFYQARVALFLLLQCPDETLVKVEALDDIEVLNPTAQAKLTLSQLKHHINKEADLSDYGVDLWKSIRVWSEQVADRSFALRDTRLHLLTTAKAVPGTAVSKLGASGRDVPGAEAQLITVAKTSGNSALKSSFDAFNSLSATQRTALVSSITIIDQHENIEEYKPKIKQCIRPAVRKQYVDGLYERLEGWWFDQIVQHLLNRCSTPSISAFSLNEKTASLAEGFHEENLPIDFLDHTPDADFVEASQSKLFVKQLGAIQAKSRVVSKAILDYYRAFNQRSRWLNEGLVFAEELASYERTLVDEWERYFDSICGESLESMSKDDLVSIGQQLLNWAEFKATNLRIRPRVEADFVRRGSFHMLADKQPIPLVFWHPTFVEDMVSTMAKAASTS